MEEDDSKSQSPQEDSHVRLEQFVTKNAEGFQELVEEILDEIAQDGNLSEMTDELYDQKKSYLTKHLIELSCIHKVLADQISTTLRYSAPIGTDLVLSGGFSGSSSDSLVSTNKLIISPVVNARKDKETKALEILLQLSMNSDDHGNENGMVIEVEKVVADLKHALYVSNRKNKEMGIELEALKKKVVISDIVIKDLIQQRSNQDSKERQIEKEKQSLIQSVHYVSEQVRCYEAKILELEEEQSAYEDEISKHDDEIAEVKKTSKKYASEITQLKNEITQLKNEITQLKNAHKAKENNWRTSIGKLRNELDEKSESVDVLNEKLDTVRAEKFSQDNLIQELEEMNKTYTSEITQLKSAYEETEINWRYSVGKLRNELEEKSESVDVLNEKLDTVRAEKCFQENLVQELEKMNKTYTSEITQLKSEYKETENNWRTSVGKLRKELEEKSESVDVLKLKLDTVQAEKCSQDNLIQELEKTNKTYTSEITQLKSTYKETENNWKDTIGKLRTELGKKDESVDDMTKKLDTLQAEKCSQENLVQELEEMNKSYTSEITQLKSTYKETENNWKDTIGKLRTELEKKDGSVTDLTKKLDTLQAEKCSQENLVQKLETRLNSLQPDHVGALVSFDISQKVTDELAERVLELQKEVDMQRELISVRDDEKREAIRQLSSSLLHYKSKYQQLHKAFVNKNTASCFDFLH